MKHICWVLLVMFIFAVPSMAQNKSIELGVSCYTAGTPYCKAHASLIFRLDAGGRTYSYSSFEFRGAGEQPITSIRTGLWTRVASIGKCKVGGLVDGGVSTTSTTTTGSFAGGVAIPCQLKPNFTIMPEAQFLVDPSSTASSSTATPLGENKQLVVGIGVVLPLVTD
jgi:hypothetical protein